MSDNPLGKQTVYPSTYDPDLLFPVSRAENRSKILNAPDQLPFGGFDHWRAYELSWLSPTGQPVAALADILVPCDSPFLIESKSMKLYFNSLNMKMFKNTESVRARIALDLGEVAGAAVQVSLYACDDALMHTSHVPDGCLLDDLTVNASVYHPDPALLQCQPDTEVSETLYSHLFRSNCPITAQPDWGSIRIQYQGSAIDHHSLLLYLISYRQHEGFHEHCVEQIFQDLSAACRPRELQVSINFLRRGGLEINPLRSSNKSVALQPLPRLLRQ
ncbi:MAG: NADPH-dependent 7-cyano-7-deazaguanine reductase QueF [Pseudohongiella sp.]|uniref:NADPH-dependent 7-cyano-7-deazaguanine reductase QueF n=1 Tax=Pseudohongiella sp. TaxID=1979412 RepID=UPI0034A02A26